MRGLNPAPPCSSISTVRNCSSFRLPCGATSPLQQDGAQLIDQSRPLPDQPIPRPMERLHVELVLALQVDEAHRRSGRRFGDPFGVAIVVLLRLDVGSDIFGRHQPDVVAMSGEHTAEMMGAAAGLHPDNALGKFLRQPDQRLTSYLAPHHDRAGPVEPDHAADFLPRSTPRTEIVAIPNSSSCNRRDPTTPEGGAGHSIKVAEIVAEEASLHPDTPIEAFATDEHRLGLKPVTRRVWPPVGERPIAHGHHRFEWLYVTAFVSPATGESFWYISNGVSKPLFEALLRLFAEEAGAGRDRRIVLVLDNAGWHGESGLAVPDGLRLLFQPAYTPEVQPAETL